MQRHPMASNDDPDDLGPRDDGSEGIAEQDLWFLPGPEDADPAHRLPGPHPDPAETETLAEWVRAEATHAARLAGVAWRLGGLDERLRRGPPGWRQRLALIEAADLSWLVGMRVDSDRLAQWITLHYSGAQDDTATLARAAWAVRRLSGSAADPETDLPGFLDRREGAPGSEGLSERAGAWQGMMARAGTLHPITRAAMGYHLWAMAGLGPDGDRLEAAVTAARVAASGSAGAAFVPLAMGGASGLRAGGTAADRLALWLDGVQVACLAALRHIDRVEAWTVRAETVMAPLSGRTPAALRRVLADWPVVSAPMAEALTGASRAAVQRNLGWMQNHGLIREVTGQERFRLWRIR